MKLISGNNVTTPQCSKEGGGRIQPAHIWRCLLMTPQNVCCIFIHDCAWCVDIVTTNDFYHLHCCQFLIGGHCIVKLVLSVFLPYTKNKTLYIIGKTAVVHPYYVPHPLSSSTSMCVYLHRDGDTTSPQNKTRGLVWVQACRAVANLAAPLVRLYTSLKWIMVILSFVIASCHNNVCKKLGLKWHGHVPPSC